MDGRRNNKGVVGNKGGRPSKAEEQKLIEDLKPMKEDAQRVLFQAIKTGEQWAVKLWFEYFYGKPKQRVEVTTPDAKALPDYFKSAQGD